MSENLSRKEIHFTEDMVKPLLETRFINVYDLQYQEGRHYYDATRRKKNDLTALQTDEEFRAGIPDAVSCYVILEFPDDEPRLLTFYEFRYPAGRYLLSIPAGLIDPDDRDADDPVLTAARREIREETGVDIKDSDIIYTVNPMAFSSPGMTDESNALVCAVVRLDDRSSLSHKGITGYEKMEDFKLLTKQEALDIIKSGRDEFGNTFSLMTWSGLMYFISDMWKENKN
ncbi:MAG: NUDIX hydrolase [Candidatus Weimeria sp.]